MKKILIIICCITGLGMTGENTYRESAINIGDIGRTQFILQRDALAAAMITNTTNPDARTKQAVLEDKISEGDENELVFDFGIYIPNSFTPNDDGLNDRFHVYGYGISQGKMTIYNRWGETLYSSDCLTNGWDGKFNDKSCEVATYVYFVEYSTEQGNTYSKIGHVNLIK